MLYRKIIGTVFIATMMTAVPALGQEAAVAPEEPIRTISVEMRKLRGSGSMTGSRNARVTKSRNCFSRMTLRSEPVQFSSTPSTGKALGLVSLTRVRRNRKNSRC